METPPVSIQIPFLRSISGGKAAGVILLLSVVVFTFLTWLVYFKPRAGYQSGLISALPALNATLNGISSVLLVAGYRAIRQRKLTAHVRFMLGALLSSALFFVSYVVYHHFHGDTKFTGQGVIRPVYFFVLITHIGLSAPAVPLILSTFYLALSGKFRLHRTVAKFTFPIWLYVSVTGVLIFVLLKTFSP